MTAVTPTTVAKRDVPNDANYGTARRLVEIYVEASPAATNTLNLATYVPNLSAISTINGRSSAFVSSEIATFSGTTLTFPKGGTQAVTVTGYYT